MTIGTGLCAEQAAEITYGREMFTLGASTVTSIRVPPL